jgi:hypothetical protein
VSDKIIRFPGFILLDDRNTILKDGRRYKSMKALIDDLPYQDLRLTYQWRVRQRLKLRGITNPTPEDIHAAGVLDYRARTLRDALIESGSGGKPHGARHGGQGGAA